MKRNSEPETPSGKGRTWQAVQEELHEIVWLVSVVGVLSAAGVGLAVALAANS